MLDIKRNKDEVVEFFFTLNEQDKRAMFAMLQNFPRTRFFTLLRNDGFIHLIQKYQEVVPYFKEINERFELSNIYFLNHLGQAYDLLMNPSRISDEFKQCLDELTIPYKDFKKWLKQVSKLLPKRPPSEGTLNLNNLHFKIAQEIAEALSTIWCVKKVILFGSVAKGTERPESDIDLAIEFFCSARTNRKFIEHSIDSMVKSVLKPIDQKYVNIVGTDKGMYDILNLTSAPKRNMEMFEAQGFFQNSIILFERSNPELNIDGKSTNIEVNKIIGWVDIRNLPGNNYCLIIEKESEHLTIVGMNGSKVLGMGQFELIKVVTGDFKFDANSLKITDVYDENVADVFRHMPHFLNENTQWF